MNKTGMSKKAQTVQGLKYLESRLLLPLNYTPNAPLGVRQYAVGRVWSVLHSFFTSPFLCLFKDYLFECWGKNKYFQKALPMWVKIWYTEEKGKRKARMK